MNSVFSVTVILGFIGVNLRLSAVKFSALTFSGGEAFLREGHAVGDRRKPGAMAFDSGKPCLQARLIGDLESRVGSRTIAITGTPRNTNDWMRSLSGLGPTKS